MGIQVLDFFLDFFLWNCFKWEILVWTSLRLHDFYTLVVFEFIQIDFNFRSLISCKLTSKVSSGFIFSSEIYSQRVYWKFLLCKTIWCYFFSYYRRLANCEFSLFNYHHFWTSFIFVRKEVLQRFQKFVVLCHITDVCIAKNIFLVCFIKLT